MQWLVMDFKLETINTKVSMEDIIILIMQLNFIEVYNIILKSRI